MLIYDLATEGSVDVVERMRLQEALAELDLHKTKRIDPATAARVGKLLGASWIVFGGLFTLGESLAVNVRIMEVETSLIRPGFKGNAKAEEFFQLQEQMSSRGDCEPLEDSALPP